ncbi:MAG: hypothetical protein KY394_01970 [Actinobacteria bacterium]|nr:hypothetical protein [Actinomycetota bacterium]
MSNEIVAALVAGAILVIAGLAVSAVSTPAVAIAEEGRLAEHGPAARGMGFLEGVLDGLVEEGAISEGDAAAVLGAVGEAVAEARESRRERRQQLRDTFGKGARLGALLGDRGITREELDRLPDGHPLGQLDLDQYLADGVITADELREIWREHRRG